MGIVKMVKQSFSWEQKVAAGLYIFPLPDGLPKTPE